MSNLRQLEEEVQELTLRVARREDQVLEQKQIVEQLHHRAMKAELELVNERREVEQLRKDNQVLLEHIEMLRARSEVQLRALQDLVEGYAKFSTGTGRDAMATALEEAGQVLRETKRSGK